MIEIHNNLTGPPRPTLRKYDLYIADMEDFIDRDIREMKEDPETYTIRHIWFMAKKKGCSLRGLKPIKAHKQKILNRYKKSCMREFEVSYSESVSSGKFEPPRD